MQTFQFDVPLLVFGIIILLWLRQKKSATIFQIACQVIGTIWAQHSFIVSWSIGRLVPFISASSYIPEKLKVGEVFYPFICYVTFGGLFSSLFWNVPSEVEFAYGAGRFWVQLVIFFTLVLSTRSLAFAVIDENGPLYLWRGVIIIGILHGSAFIYQYFASYFGLPLISISRAHNLTLDFGVGDVAAFDANGVDVLRPGGLAGEPKSVAILFGIVLLCRIFSGNPRGISKNWIFASNLSLFFSVLGFIGAFSTSGFIGFLISMGAIFLIKGNLRAVLNFIIIASICAVGDFVFKSLELFSLMDLMSMRTTERFSGGGMDPPVEAALDIMSNNIFLMLFGVGNGGSTFYIQEQMNAPFEYAITPNIGGVALLIEVGFLGILLLFVPFFMLIRMALSRVAEFDEGDSWGVYFLIILSMTVMMFMLTGSGIPLGYPLSIGCILGAINRINIK